MGLPEENKRVKKLIDLYCKGNINQFSKLINVSQPRINRLFNLDQRSGKYPIVSFDIAQSIINKFIDVNAEWLLIGEGEMLKSTTDHPQMENETIIAQKKLIAMQEKEIARLEQELSATKSANKPQGSIATRVAPHPEELNK